MGSFIQYEQKKKDDLFNFLEVAKTGQSLALEFNVGHRDHILQFIKHGKKTAFAYFVYKYWWRADNYDGWVFKCTKDRILWNPNRGNSTNFKEKWNKYYHEDRLRGFLRVGLIPGYKTKYYQRDNIGRLTKDENNELIHKQYPHGIGIRYLREVHIINFNGTETVSFEPMKFDWEGNLLSKIPYHCKIKLEEIKESNREANNRNARANYSNTRVVNLLKNKAFDKLKVKDIFSLNNVTHRTQLINHFGMETVLGSITHKVLDTEKINNSNYQLLEVLIPDTRPGIDTYIKGNYLKMDNQSSDEIHIEGVANYLDNLQQVPITTVRAALSWRDTDYNLNRPKSTDTYIVPEIIT